MFWSQLMLETFFSNRAKFNSLAINVMKTLTYTFCVN